MAFTSIQATGFLYTTSLGVIPDLNRFVLRSMSKIFSGSVSGKKCAIIRKPFLERQKIMFLLEKITHEALLIALGRPRRDWEPMAPLNQPESLFQDPEKVLINGLVRRERAKTISAGFSMFRYKELNILLQRVKFFLTRKQTRIIRF